MPQDLGEAGSQGATEAQGALDALSALPIGAHLTVVVALLVGLALWLFGRKLAKPAFLLVGAVLGGAAGFLILPAVGAPDLADIPSPYWGLGVGAAAGLLIAGFVFRFTMALASAAVVGLAGLLISSVYVTANPPAPERTAWVHTPALASIAPPLTLFQLRLPGVRVLPVGQDSEGIPPLPGTPGAEPDQPAPLPGDEPTVEPGPPETLGDAADRVRNFLEVLSSEIRTIWESQPEEGRLIVLGSTVIGLAVGFLIGLGAPNRAAIMVTAMAGAAIWLPSAVVLFHALELPAREALVWGPRGWLIAWAVASLIGVGAQFVLTRKARPESNGSRANGKDG